MNYFILIWAILLSPLTYSAEVPCAQYNQLTNSTISCERIPTIKISDDKYKKLLEKDRAHQCEQAVRRKYAVSACPKADEKMLWLSADATACEKAIYACSQTMSEKPVKLPEEKLW